MFAIENLFCLFCFVFACKVTVWCLVMNNSGVNENTVSSSSELNHLFIADSLQLTNLTLRFGRAESFATSISLEKLYRSVSSFKRSNIKVDPKHFSSQNTPNSSYKAF